MKIRITNSDFTPINVTGDIIALLCCMLLGLGMIVGGTAFGISHYEKSKHYQLVRE